LLDYSIHFSKLLTPTDLHSNSSNIQEKTANAQYANSQNKMTVMSISYNNIWSKNFQKTYWND